MRCGIAQSVARVGNTSPDHCRHGIGYQLARSALYEALAVLAAAYPSDVILVNHILSIQWCAVRARRIVLPSVVACGQCRGIPPTRAKLGCALHERNLVTHNRD